MSDSTSAENCIYYVANIINDTLSRNEESFSLLHLNIHRLQMHYSDLDHYLRCLSIVFSVLGLGETWFNENNYALYNFDNYINVYLYRKDRRGCGVSLFIKNNLAYKVIDELNITINVYS